MLRETMPKEASHEDLISHLADRSFQPGLQALELGIEL